MNTLNGPFLSEINLIKVTVTKCTKEVEHTCGGQSNESVNEIHFLKKKLVRI